MSDNNSENEIRRLSTNPEVAIIYFYSFFLIAIIIFSPYRLFIIPLFLYGLKVLLKHLYVWVDFYDDYFVINTWRNKKTKFKYDDAVSFILTKTTHAAIYNGRFSLTINLKNKTSIAKRSVYDVYNYNDEFYFFLSKRSIVFKSNY